eukprot:353375-Chlamydomonas_euryale.AAC.10
MVTDVRCASHGARPRRILIVGPRWHPRCGARAAGCLSGRPYSHHGLAVREHACYMRLSR